MCGCVSIATVSVLASRHQHSGLLVLLLVLLVSMLNLLRNCVKNNFHALLDYFIMPSEWSRFANVIIAKIRLQTHPMCARLNSCDGTEDYSGGVLTDAHTYYTPKRTHSPRLTHTLSHIFTTVSALNSSLHHTNDSPVRKTDNHPDSGDGVCACAHK